MKTFNIISGVILLSVLSCVHPARYHHVRGKHKSHVSLHHHKQMFGKIMSAVASTVADIVSGSDTRSDGSAKKGLPGTYPMNDPTFKTVSSEPVAYGLARIVLYKVGVLCSGIHLKPWIVLTTAECVQNKDVNKMFVEITIRNDTKKVTERVSSTVHSVTLDPMFKQGEFQHNLALLHVFADFNWNVEEFQLPRNIWTPEKIISEHIAVQTMKWVKKDEKNYIAQEVSTALKTDYSVCGEIGPSDNWFCAEVVKKEKFTKVDIGMPVFRKVGKLKRCIAIFTGRHLDEDFKGHIYEGIHPSMTWIEEFIYEHPVPAFYY